MEHLNEELQAEVIQQDIADGDKEIPDNLFSAFQRGAREADVPSHPEARQESDGKLEDEGRNMRRESHKAQVDNPLANNEMIEHIIQHPFQRQVQSATGGVTEQLKAYHLAERGIEEIDDRSQSAFYPGFYVAECWQVVTGG